MVLRRLIYVSRVARQVRYADAESIASVAAGRNELAGITGLLLYTPSHFVQVLEGEREAVSSTFERIRHDPRHAGVRIIEDRDVTEREFGQWFMHARLCAASSVAFEHADVDDVLALLREPGA